MHRLYSLLVIPAALALHGCAVAPYYPPIPLTGDPMVDGPNAIQNGPPRDRVLWQYRTALAAMHRGLHDEAAGYLDAALDRVEGAIGSDPEARKARGYFNPEARKVFIGEPYERAMAYYYRGVLFWMKGDLGNARACFRSAQFQDADTEEHAYASDYALLDYLEGYTSLKLGDDATSPLKRARENARLNPLPPADPTANVLFFIDYGVGPEKFATGQYSEQLRFRPGAPSPVATVRIQIGSDSLAAPPYDDLYFQATTRGGRVMDHILANKAVFKANTESLGDAALISGMIMAQDQENEEVALGLMGLGLLVKAISASATPQADVRAWDALPLHLSFAALHLPPGDYSADVHFLDAASQPLPDYSMTVHFTVPASGGDTVVYLSDQSITTQSP